MIPGSLSVGGLLDKYVARLFVLSYLAAFFLVVGALYFRNGASNMKASAFVLYIPPAKRTTNPPPDEWPPRTISELSRPCRTLSIRSAMSSSSWLM